MTESSHTFGPVSYTQTDTVATLTIDDGKANALSHELIGYLYEALEQVQSDDAGAIVIAGRPGRFCAGFDLSIMTSGMDAAASLLGKGADLAVDILELNRPVVFAVTGHALAMGSILLCAPDYRVGAAGDYKIGLNEVRIGMPVPPFAAELCRDRLTKTEFHSATQLAKIYAPDGARDAGFLDEVVPLEDVVTRAQEIAHSFATELHRDAFIASRKIVRFNLMNTLKSILAEPDEEFFVATTS